MARLVAGAGGARDERRPTRSTRSASSGSSRRGCPTAPSSRADSGSSANWFARDLKIRPRHDGLALRQPRHHGPGRALRDRAPSSPTRSGPVVALVGDGAMQMNGINELITVAKYWKRVEGPAAGRAGAQQPRPQPGHLGAAGDERRPEARGIAGHARLPLRRATRSRSGSKGIRVDRPEQIGPAWDEALRRRPAGASSRRSPIPRCRRCRRTSPSSRRRRCVGARSEGRPRARRHRSGRRREQMIDELVPGQGLAVAARATAASADRGDRGSAATVPDRRARSRTARYAWDRTTLVVVAGSGRAGARARLHLRRPSPRARLDPRPRSRRVVHGRGRARRRACLPAAMQAAVRNVGRAGRGGDGDLRASTRRSGTSRRGSSGCRCCRCSARPATACRSTAAAASPRTRSRAARSSSSAAGPQQGFRRVKMKVGARARGGPRRGCARRARRSGPARSCSWTRTAPIVASRRCAQAEAFAQRGRDLVRGAGLVRRSRRAAAAARSRARRDGHRRRRVRLRRPSTSGACSRPARWTCSRPTRPAAAGRPASCAAAALCEACQLPLSAHCAPRAARPPVLRAGRAVHLE